MMFAYIPPEKKFGEYIYTCIFVYMYTRIRSKGIERGEVRFGRELFEQPVLK